MMMGLKDSLVGLCCVMSVLFLSACGDSRQESPVAPERSAMDGTLKVESQSGVRIQVTPEQPISADCLNAVTMGATNQGKYRWLVNGQVVAGQGESRLCPDFFRRGDRVVVEIGTGPSGASAAVTIANSPPRVAGISATPNQVFGDSDVVVIPAGEDKDGDPVEFRYQWLVNGQANPFLTESKLSKDHFNKGDVIQVRVTPYDGRDEGPVYESYQMTIPNAPPRIESNPPQQFEALEYRYQVAAADADGDSLTWRLDKAPAGMTIDPVAGLISWPLTGVAPGAYPMRIVVRDPDGGEAFQEYTLTLGPPK